MLEWGKPDERYYHHGIDRGVLYTSIKSGGTGIAQSIEEPLSDANSGALAVPWNGITGFDEAGNGSSAIYYIDGRVYLADVDATDFNGKLTAYAWPDALSECLGIPAATPGFYVDNQKPKPFHFSYRTLVGSGAAGDKFGHQIHLVYNAMASISGRARRTVNNRTDPIDFGFDLVCTPVALPGYRPSAHYIIDSRYLSASRLAELETIIYGSETSVARMPTPLELFDLLAFGDAITFVKWTHPVLGSCWTATGSSSNLKKPTPDTFEILNVNGSWIDEAQGFYQLQDTP